MLPGFSSHRSSARSSARVSPCREQRWFCPLRGRPALPELKVNRVDLDLPESPDLRAPRARPETRASQDHQVRWDQKARQARKAGGSRPASMSSARPAPAPKGWSATRASPCWSKFHGARLDRNSIELSTSVRCVELL